MEEEKQVGKVQLSTLHSIPSNLTRIELVSYISRIHNLFDF